MKREWERSINSPRRGRPRVPKACWQAWSSCWRTLLKSEAGGRGSMMTGRLSGRPGQGNPIRMVGGRQVVLYLERWAFPANNARKRRGSGGYDLLRC